MITVGTHAIPGGQGPLHWDVVPGTGPQDPG